MALPVTSTAPNTDAAQSSLGRAADAAFKAYSAAQTTDPSADTSLLYARWTQLDAAYTAALSQSFRTGTIAVDVAAAVAALDSATATIRAEASTIRNIATWVTLLDHLVQLASTVASFLG